MKNIKYVVLILMGYISVNASTSSNVEVDSTPINVKNLIHSLNKSDKRSEVDSTSIGRVLVVKQKHESAAKRQKPPQGSAEEGSLIPPCDECKEHLKWTAEEREQSGEQLRALRERAKNITPPPSPQEQGFLSWITSWWS